MDTKRGRAVNDPGKTEGLRQHCIFIWSRVRRTPMFPTVACKMVEYCGEATDRAGRQLGSQVLALCGHSERAKGGTSDEGLNGEAVNNFWITRRKSS